MSFEKWESDGMVRTCITVTIYRTGLVYMSRAAVFSLRLNRTSRVKVLRSPDHRVLALRRSNQARRANRIGHHRRSSSVRMPRIWAEEAVQGLKRKFRAWRDEDARAVVIDLEHPIGKGRPRRDEVRIR